MSCIHVYGMCAAGAWVALGWIPGEYAVAKRKPSSCVSNLSYLLLQNMATPRSGAISMLPGTGEQDMDWLMAHCANRQISNVWATFKGGWVGAWRVLGKQELTMMIRSQQASSLGPWRSPSDSPHAWLCDMKTETWIRRCWASPYLG